MCLPYVQAVRALVNLIPKDGVHIEDLTPGNVKGATLCTAVNFQTATSFDVDDLADVVVVRWCIAVFYTATVRGHMGS